MAKKNPQYLVILDNCDGTTTRHTFGSGLNIGVAIVVKLSKDIDATRRAGDEILMGVSRDLATAKGRAVDATQMGAVRVVPLLPGDSAATVSPAPVLTLAQAPAWNLSTRRLVGMRGFSQATDLVAPDATILDVAKRAAADSKVTSIKVRMGDTIWTWYRS